jgi:hypothetical protein
MATFKWGKHTTKQVLKLFPKLVTQGARVQFVGPYFNNTFSAVKHNFLFGMHFILNLLLLILFTFCCYNSETNGEMCSSDGERGNIYTIPGSKHHGKRSLGGPKR